MIRPYRALTIFDMTVTSEQDPDSATVGRWGMGEVVLGLLLAVSGSYLTVSIFRGLTGTSFDDPRTLGVTLASFVGLWSGWLGVCFYSVKARGSGAFRRDLGLGFDWKKDLPAGLLVGLAGQALTFVIYLPVAIFDPDTAEQVGDAAESLTGIAEGLGLVPLGLAICLLAPVMEEIFFRGLTFRAISNRWGPMAGVIGSAVIFGLIHGQSLQIPALIGLGVLLALAVRRSGRLGPAIVGHCTFNTITFIVLLTN
jgi:uncharacterized protein